MDRLLAVIALVCLQACLNPAAQARGSSRPHGLTTTRLAYAPALSSPAEISVRHAVLA